MDVATGLFVHPPLPPRSPPDPLPGQQSPRSSFSARASSLVPHGTCLDLAQQRGWRTPYVVMRCQSRRHHVALTPTPRARPNHRANNANTPGRRVPMSPIGRTSSNPTHCVHRENDQTRHNRCIRMELLGAGYSKRRLRGSVALVNVVSRAIFRPALANYWGDELWAISSRWCSAGK